MTSPRHNRRAFTLVEVILVGAVVSALLWIRLGYGERSAQQTQAGEHVSDLRAVAERYLAATGHCPTMRALVEHDHLSSAEIDPWGKEYWFACRKGAVTVVSDGRDGRPFTSDDVSDPVAWQPARRQLDARPKWMGAS